MQDLFAEALAYALPADPRIVTARLEGSPKLRNVAALCSALERSQIAERYASGETMAELATGYGVSEPTI